MLSLFCSPFRERESPPSSSKIPLSSLFPRRLIAVKISRRGITILSRVHTSPTERETPVAGTDTDRPAKSIYNRPGQLKRFSKGGRGPVRLRSRAALLYVPDRSLNYALPEHTIEPDDVIPPMRFEHPRILVPGSCSATPQHRSFLYFF